MKARFICMSIGALLLPPCVLAQWVHTALDTASVDCFAFDGVYLYVGTESGVVYRSADSGTHWTAASSLSAPVYSLLKSGANLIAGTYIGPPAQGNCAFVSTDGGTSWKVGSGLASSSVLALAGSGTSVFAGTGGNSVFLSTDSGMSWTPANAGISKQVVMSLAVSGSNVFAGTNGAGVYRSTDNGISWTVVNEGLTNNAVWSLAVSGTNLYAGVTGGVFRSTDNAASWSQVKDGVTVLKLSADGPYLVGRFGPNEGSVFLSTNCGTDWIDINAGLTWDVWSVFVHGDYVFAGPWGEGVWRRSLAGIIGDVAELSRLPGKYALHQNYPNPFNPTTTIQFTIVNRQLTIVKVYDLLGNEVVTLVNEVKEPGTYTVQFNGSNLASGVYFYRLNAGTFVETKKLLLLR